MCVCGCVLFYCDPNWARGEREQERVTVCKVACFIATRIALDERRNGVVRCRPPRQNVGSRRCWEVGEKGEKQQEGVILQLWLDHLANTHTHTQTMNKNWYGMCVMRRTGLCFNWLLKKVLRTHTIQICCIYSKHYTVLIIIIIRHLLPIRLYIIHVIYLVYLEVF